MKTKRQVIATWDMSMVMFKLQYPFVLNLTIVETCLLLYLGLKTAFSGFLLDFYLISKFLMETDKFSIIEMTPRLATYLNFLYAFFFFYIKLSPFLSLFRLLC